MFYIIYYVIKAANLPSKSQLNQQLADTQLPPANKNSHAADDANNPKRQSEI